MGLRKIYKKGVKLPDGYYRNEAGTTYYLLDGDKRIQIYNSDNFSSLIWDKTNDIEDVTACTKEEFEKALLMVMAKCKMEKKEVGRFQIEVIATSSKVITIEAETQVEALERAKAMYTETEFGFSASDVIEVNFFNL